MVAKTETSVLSRACFTSSRFIYRLPRFPSCRYVGKGASCGWVCDVPGPVALRLPPSQTRFPRPPWRTPSPSRDWRGFGGSRLSNPRLINKLKQVPLAKEMQVRLGGSPRLKYSYSPPQTLCRLNCSFLMPCRFFYAYRTLAFPLRHSSAGWCLPMSVAWRTLRPSIETKLTSSLPPLQLQDSSDHTAHVTKRAFALPSRADCRFAEDRRRSPAVQPPPFQVVTSDGSSCYI